MLMFAILRLAFGSLAANKLRSGLTMLAIMIGVASVILAMTAIDSMRESVESGLNILGANSFQIGKSPPLSFTSTSSSRFRNRRDITYAVAKRFKTLLGDAGQVNLTINRGGLTVALRERRTNPDVALIGTDENFATALGFDIASGRNLGPEDVEYGRPVCVLGADVVRRISPDRSCIGQTVRMGGQSYIVVGTLAPKGASFGQSQDNRVLLPVTRFFAVYGRASRSVTINVQAKSQASLADTVEVATGTMRLVRGLHPEDTNDFEITSNESLIEAFNRIANIVAIGALIISGVALVAAGVGVMNIMLVSVTERTKEIGIRKSIGAKRNTILTQFLAEAMALAMMGGFVGIGIGVGMGNVIAVVIVHSGFVVPWLWTGVGLLVCGGVGVTAGLYPAWKAASLDPIEALRYE